MSAADKLHVFIQARMSSQRLPGKVLMRSAGRPLLEYVLDRVRTSAFAENISVITSVEKSDDPIEVFCRDSGIRCVRGPLQDVAGRYAEAIRKTGAEYFVRVCADSPFLDPKIIDCVSEKIISDKYDIVTNACPRSFPKGLTMEASRAGFFIEHAERFTAEQKENIFTYFYRETDRFNICNISNEEGDWSEHNLSVDTEEDWKFFEEQVRLYGKGFSKEDWRNIFRSRHPQKAVR